MNYSLRRQNESYFVRYQDGRAFIYYTTASSNECDINLVFFCYDFYYNFLDYTTNWSSDSCDNINTHEISLPYTPYIWPYMSSPPPVSASGLLCPKNYPYNQATVRISNRIKVTVHDDPVFSGVYVFDGNDVGVWSLNSQLSAYNIETNDEFYYSSNIRFFQMFDPLNWDPANPYPLDGIPAYFETLYNTQNLVNPDPPCENPYTQTFRMLDSYAFPASFVLTAIQRSVVNNDSLYTGGHRLSLGFTLPVRYRKGYKDWIVVDKVPHAISGYKNYSHPVVVDNCNSYIDFDFLEYGTHYPRSDYAGNITGIKCSGIDDFGFAFRVNSSLLARNNFDSQTENAPSNYLNSRQYIRDDGFIDGAVINGWGAQFFGPKIPINASVEFIYSCRPGLPCFNLTPSIINPITATGYGCIEDYYSVINVDYLCGGSPQDRPDDNYWIDNNIISTNIIYSGISGLLPTIYKYGGFTFDDSESIVYDAYVSYEENPIISIPYTGDSKPNSIRDWIRRDLRLVSFDKQDNGTFNTNSISFTNPTIDLYWNINGNNATAYIIPNDENLYDGISRQLMLIGAGTPEVNGRYVWYKGGGSQFYQTTPNYGFSIRLSYDDDKPINHRYEWLVGKDHSDKWIPYYATSGSIGIRNLDNNSYINTSGWYIPNNCYSGIYPPPNTTTQPTTNRFILVRDAPNNPVGIPVSDAVFNTYYYNNEPGVWTSIENSNIQIRLINSNYFMGIFINNIYNIYYILYNGYNQFLNTETVYYGKKLGNTLGILKLDRDAHPNCSSDPTPPETITISTQAGDAYPIGTGVATLRFWRNIYSVCNSGSGIEVTDQTITISCASGSISVNNETINAGSSKVFYNIAFSFANNTVLQDSIVGRNNLIFVQGLTTDAAFSGNATLNWNNTRDHDLYGQITVSNTGQSNVPIPVGQWISNNYYLGIGNPNSILEII